MRPVEIELAVSEFEQWFEADSARNIYAVVPLWLAAAQAQAGRITEAIGLNMSTWAYPYVVSLWICFEMAFSNRIMDSISSSWI